MIEACDREIRQHLEQFQPPTTPTAPPSEAEAATNRQSTEGILRSELQRVWGVDLTRIPGIRTGIAQMLFGEIGPDFTKFCSASAFESWMGLCPDNDISGGKVLFVGTRKVKCRAALALRMAAKSLHHRKCALGDFHRRMRAKLGAPKAITAAAHKLARIIFHLISTRQEIDDSKFAADQLHYQKRQEAKLHAKAKSMGCGYFGTTRKGCRISWLSFRWACERHAKGRDMRISRGLGAATSRLDELGVLTESSCGELLQAM
jgi:transposase